MASFELRKTGDRHYQVSGDLTFETVSARVDVLSDCLDGDSLVVDLSSVARADSACLALLLEWERRALSRGVDLRYAGLTDQMLAIAGLSDLGDVIPTAPA